MNQQNNMTGHIRKAKYQTLYKIKYVDRAWLLLPLINYYFFCLPVQMLIKKIMLYEKSFLFLIEKYSEI